MLFKNVWYVAEFSSALTDQPLKVRMLGRDFVLFRDTKGQAACLSSVCCHRGAPLSGGEIRTVTSVDQVHAGTEASG